MTDDTALASDEWDAGAAGAATRRGVALCLSGGGFRAMLFHVGTLWRLNDVGYLPRIALVSSVSGGSITAGTLAVAWPRLSFDDRGVARGFVPELAMPLLRMAGRTIDIPAVLLGMVCPGGPGNQVARAYARHLFGERTLQDLPDDRSAPHFVITAANLQSGVLWQFSRRSAGDYRVGRTSRPTIPLASAVAASSAFPPFLAPLVLHFDPSTARFTGGLDLQRPPYTTRAILADGGVYDNLGFEPAKSYATVLVSDGGLKIEAQERPGGDWPRQLYRVFNLVDNQVRSLRKRQLIASYETPPGCPGHRKGSYWGIRADIADYDLPDALPAPHEATLGLAAVSTRLSRLAPVVRQRLVNWGYAICDAALRRYVDPSLPAPAGFPFPTVGVGS